ncbi:hypothetical protein [Streptomyces sp. NPDC087272]|uniref:hypothetical protein n=1 Tax=Streptomyces sp. NPDC087272 TaxID=3365775 RepID=UPI0038258BDC
MTTAPTPPGRARTLTPDEFERACTQLITAVHKRGGQLDTSAARDALAETLATIGVSAPTVESPHLEVVDTATGEIIDLATATYSYVLDGIPSTVRTIVKHRTVRTTGERLIYIRGLAPLLAGHIDAITDEGDRLSALVVLDGTRITLGERQSEVWPGILSVRHGGLVRTDYTGTPRLPVSRVLDIAEQLYHQVHPGRLKPQ